MTKTKIQPVILCGGNGTRLWPLSRAGFPKQFLCLAGDQSLFQQAVLRLQGVRDDSSLTLQPPLIVSNDEHRFLASEQLREINVNDASYLLEPVGRNTAPALTLAALAASESGEDPILVVTPSDQTILNESAFRQSMRRAIDQAAQGSIVILGITPDKPETGYGYIQANGSESENSYKVARFVEKPDQKTAEGYLKQGGYYWNAGMFVLRASVWLKALQTFRDDIAEACRNAWAEKKQDGNFVRPSKELFSEVPSESIDYAVMEKCPGSEYNIEMVELNAGWNDLGAWDAVWQVLPKDDQGNAFSGDVLSTDTQNTLVQATSRLVSLVGVKDLVVVETADAVLVADRARSQDVKNIVNKLSQQKREEQTLHRKVHRPWGWYDSIDEGGRFKVKRIQVKPKASLSLQMHHHRAEHWIVVKGTAEVTNGERTTLVTENQSTYIPLGEVHKLHNPGAIVLELIEVQTGAYLKEDDIVRLEDDYKRI